MRRIIAGLLFAALASAAQADTIGSAPAGASRNLSGSITTGGTFQPLLTGSGLTKTFEFQNICGESGACNATSDNCYLFWPGASGSKATSLLISPGAYYGRFSGTVPSDTVYVTCDTTGDKFWSESQ